MHPGKIQLAAPLPDFFVMPFPDDQPATRPLPRLPASALLDSRAALAALTRAARRRDPAAFAQFYDLYSFRIYKHLLFLTKGDEPLAGEILQTVAIKLAVKMEIFTAEPPLLAWLHRLARNAFIDHVRAHRRENLSIPLDESTHAALADSAAALLDSRAPSATLSTRPSPIARPPTASSSTPPMWMDSLSPLSPPSTAKPTRPSSPASPAFAKKSAPISSAPSAMKNNSDQNSPDPLLDAILRADSWESANAAAKAAAFRELSALRRRRHWLASAALAFTACLAAAVIWPILHSSTPNSKLPTRKSKSPPAISIQQSAILFHPQSRRQPLHSPLLQPLYPRCPPPPSATSPKPKCSPSSPKAVASSPKSTARSNSSSSTTKSKPRAHPTTRVHNRLRHRFREL